MHQYTAYVQTIVERIQQLDFYDFQSDEVENF